MSDFECNFLNVKYLTLIFETHLGGHTLAIEFEKQPFSIGTCQIQHFYIVGIFNPLNLEVCIIGRNWVWDGRVGDLKLD